MWMWAYLVGNENEYGDESESVSVGCDSSKLGVMLDSRCLWNWRTGYVGAKFLTLGVQVALPCGGYRRHATDRAAPLTVHVMILHHAIYCVLLI